MNTINEEIDFIINDTLNYVKLLSKKIMPNIIKPKVNEYRQVAEINTPDGYFEYGDDFAFPFYKIGDEIMFGKAGSVHDDITTILAVKQLGDISREREILQLTDIEHKGRIWILFNKVYIAFNNVPEDIENWKMEIWNKIKANNIQRKNTIVVYNEGDKTIINEENAMLKSHVFQIPSDLYDYLFGLYNKVKDNPQFTNLDGYKRLNNIINRKGKIGYDWIRAIKNYFDHYSGNGTDETFKLNGGNKMKKWVNDALKKAEESVEMSKNSSKDAGLNNAFIKTHYKDNSKITIDPKAVSIGGLGTKNK